MLYISTRGVHKPSSPSEALRQGVPSDGGLFVPQTIPQVDRDWVLSLAEKPYYQAAAQVLELYLTDFSKDELTAVCHEVFSEDNFGENPAFVEQLNPYNDDLYLLRLDTGPTASIKDYSMLLVPPLLTLAKKNTKDNMQQLLLTATTGSAGIAALSTLADKEDFAVMAFFASTGEPLGSEQHLKPGCGSNCFASYSSASFEELSQEIRQCLADENLVNTLRDHNVILSTANSLNWVRIVPSIAYFCWAASCLFARGRLQWGEGSMALVVPSGNGSELVAAIYAREMGIPIGKIIVTTNRNRGLADLIREGSYSRRRKLLHTDLPGLDVDLPMNVERVLYEVLGRDAVQTSIYLNDLINEGIIRLNKNDTAAMQSYLDAMSIDDRRIASIILSIYDRTDYALDPHTAGFIFAYETWNDRQRGDFPAIVLNTDSPYRFTRTMSEALLGRGYVRGRSNSVLVSELEQEIGLDLPQIFTEMIDGEVTALPVVNKDEIAQNILEQLGIA
ncbi:MAG TPA: hypothetical protein VFF56_03615 [Bacillota bacterium]|nr:hypothetical protein [Bacillota bacterium]